MNDTPSIVIFTIGVVLFFMFALVGGNQLGYWSGRGSICDTWEPFVEPASDETRAYTIWCERNPE